jgi:hypothetical protein
MQYDLLLGMCRHQHSPTDVRIADSGNNHPSTPVTRVLESLHYYAISAPSAPTVRAAVQSPTPLRSVQIGKATGLSPDQS